MKKFYCVCIILTFFVGTAFAQSSNSLETVSGLIPTDTSWTADTILIIGDIYIPDSVCLTINPGTVVLFDSNYYFDVQGRILAQGTASEPILFSVVDTTGFYDLTHIGWGGFYYDEPDLSIDSSLFEYCVFEYLYNGYAESVFQIRNFSKIRVENSQFSYNISENQAACFSIDGESNIIIRNNVFTYNHGYKSCIDVNCNTTSFASEPLIERNIFRYNTTGKGYASASCLKLSTATKAKVINNIFEYNEGWYGTILISGSAEPLLFGNLIASNRSEIGGAIKLKYLTNPGFINNTIVNNHSNTAGGAFHIGCESKNLLFQNNIIWGNTADSIGSQFYCYDNGTSGYVFRNNIIQFGTDSMYFKNTFSGVYEDNLDVFPTFADFDNEDYHLSCASPALDAGSDPSLFLSEVHLFDLDGNPRIAGDEIDLGAYEFPSNIMIISTNTSWTADTIFITGNVYIPDSVCLTISPGTVVLFECNYYFDVQGRILAQGTASEPILFSVVDTTGFSDLTHIGWGGFYYDEPDLSIDSSLFEYCVFEYFHNGKAISVFDIRNFSKIRVENSRFSYNYSDHYAACFSLGNKSNVIIRNNIFTYNYGIRSCIDVNCNSGDFASEPLIEGNIFRYNSTGTSAESASCLKLSTETKAKVINNIFENNEGYYGTILISGDAEPLLFGNLIANNRGEIGGAIKLKSRSNPSFINNTIIYNHSNTTGGAFHIGCDSKNLLFQNNIIWRNTAKDTASQFYCNDDGTSGYVFRNNIIQFGLDSMYFDEVVFEGVYENNLDIDPLVADMTNRDYRLSCASPALDAGLNPTLSGFPVFDMNKNLRISGPKIDLGAYEIAAAIITAHPQTQAVNSGEDAVFTVTAYYVYTYQWVHSNDYGNTWNAITSADTFSGTNTNTLTVHTNNSLNGQFYHCVVSSYCPTQNVVSNNAILIVNNDTRIEEIDAHFSVYPNPFKSEVYIENALNAEVFVLDVNGKTIQHINQLNSTKESIHLNNISKGIYFLKIITANEVKTLKLIKE